MFGAMVSKKYWVISLGSLLLSIAGRKLFPGAGLFDSLSTISYVLIIAGITAIFIRAVIPGDLFDKDAYAASQAIPKIARDLRSDPDLPRLTQNEWEAAILVMADKQLRPEVMNGKSMDFVQNDVREEILGILDKNLEPAEGVKIVEAYTRYYNQRPGLFLDAKAKAKPHKAWDYYWPIAVIFIAVGLVASFSLRSTYGLFIVAIIVAILFMSIYAGRLWHYLKKRQN